MIFETTLIWINPGCFHVVSKACTHFSLYAAAETRRRKRFFTPVGTKRGPIVRRVLPDTTISTTQTALLFAGNVAVALAETLLPGNVTVAVNPPPPFNPWKIFAALTANAYVTPIGCALGW